MFVSPLRARLLLPCFPLLFTACASTNATSGNSGGSSDAEVVRRFQALEPKASCEAMAAVVGDFKGTAAEGSELAAALQRTYSKCLRDADNAVSHSAANLPSAYAEDSPKRFSFIESGSLSRHDAALSGGLLDLERAEAAAARLPPKERKRLKPGALERLREVATVHWKLVHAELTKRRQSEDGRLSTAVAAFDARMQQADELLAAGQVLSGHAACASAGLLFAGALATDEEKAQLKARQARQQDCLHKHAPAVKAARGLTLALDPSGLPAAEAPAFTAALKRASPAVRWVSPGEAGALATVVPSIKEPPTLSRPATTQVTLRHQYESGSVVAPNPKYKEVKELLELRERCVREAGWTHGSQCRRYGCRWCGGNVAGDNQKELLSVQKQLRETPPQLNEASTAETTYQADETRVTGQLPWRVEVRLGDGRPTRSFEGAGTASAVTYKHPGNPGVKLAARNEPPPDGAAVAKAARDSAVEGAVQACAQAAGLAASGLDPKIAAAPTPAARAELALQKALMLEAAPPAEALQALFGADVSGPVREAWREALR